MDTTGYSGTDRTTEGVTTYTTDGSADEVATSDENLLTVPRSFPIGGTPAVRFREIPLCHFPKLFSGEKFFPSGVVSEVNSLQGYFLPGSVKLRGKIDTTFQGHP